MNNPLVSVIIPLYNASTYIESTLVSICNQRYRHLEIIIIDDASTDDSYDKVESFTDSRIKLLQQSNSGAAVARNTGLKNANGHYIQFMDADDLLHPDKIRLQVEALELEPEKIAVSNYIEFFDGEDFQRKTVPTNQQDFIYSSNNPVEFLLNLWGANGKANFIQTNCWLVPRHLIDRAGVWREYRCPDDDGEFFTRVLLASKGILFVPKALNYYRRFLTEGNLSNHKNKEALENSLMTIALKKQYIETYRKDQALDTAMARQYLNFAVYNYLSNSALSNLAYENYLNLDRPLPLPKIGGPLVHQLATCIGWRTTLRIKQFFK